MSFMSNVKKYISSALAVAVVFGSFSVGLFAYGTDSVIINNINFPDKNWRTVVSNEYDLDTNGELSADELTVDTIRLTGLLEDYCGENAQINDLTGIEHFTSLKRLYCGGIGLTSLDVSALTGLEQLTCQGNNMTSLTLGSQSNLTWLNCGSNELSALDISGCPALTRINCFSNRLKVLDVTGCTGLEELYCQQNELTSVKVNGLTALRTIYCANNHLWELDLSTNTALEGITSYMLANQQVDATVEKEGSQVAVAHNFIRNDFVKSSSFDEINSATGSIEKPGFVDGYFITSHPEKVFDGLDYKYYTGNSNTDDMSVHINLTRSFFVVRYYADEEMTNLYSSQAVESGSDAVEPEIEQSTDCRTFVRWSASGQNVAEDMNIYAIWDYKHNYELQSFAKGKLNVKCTRCDAVDAIDFMSVFNSREGDKNFMETADVVKDGCINAKDYAKLAREYK